ncbi:nucleotidyl transferase AbiEii/AbiGii toxin family protein [Ornithobacterium rhinotracheale]|uniref:nucleotidyl transferase AbiEii/AbiGii toxin family protein n=1 Tax=Ornithobacterium rhinotracheale TaxID=28251 RepID=UPI00129D0037|nr:nucleotidyl transferase AbiEii/AbiGii toxin family protein [Ornithobacterium rhinotracheale]MRI64221.1 nucleotidyltransferase [Ornithobacterium rhinotracheale]MRJ11576.1 nucleotidyltransferase [Ornithobacterium rhinotracheale]
MLQTKTTPRATLELLEQLMSDEKLKEFNLAGGTALALYMGHRKSIDLDLFSQSDFNVERLEAHLVDKYNFQSEFSEKNTLKGTIQGVKIDCISNFSKLCKPIRNYENLRIYSPEDITAMKLLAIADNGTRLKDFIDIAYLSSYYSLNEMLEFASEKYPNKNRIILEKSIIFFDDIEDDNIELMQGNYKWKAIENRLYQMVRDKDRVFNLEPNIETTKNRGFRR